MKLISNKNFKMFYEVDGEILSVYDADEKLIGDTAVRDLQGCLAQLGRMRTPKALIKWFCLDGNDYSYFDTLYDAFKFELDDFTLDNDDLYDVMMTFIDARKVTLYLRHELQHWYYFGNQMFIRQAW